VTRFRYLWKHPRLSAVIGLAVIAVAVVAADGTLADLVSHMSAGRYDDARQVLGELSADNPGDPMLQIWGQRLTDDADRALELATSQVRDRGLPMSQRIEAAVDGAAVALARDDLEAAWGLLRPILDLTPDQLPGDVYLLAGLTQYQSGDRQRAREMLASVRPDSPHFVAARSLLGRIGLESGDTELALNYFESAIRHRGDQAEPELFAGRWQALHQLGRDVEARDVYADLLERHPSSLAAMEVRERRRRDDEELAAITDTLDIVAPEVLAEQSATIYAVQLAAFRDRALALQFIQRWQSELTELRIVQSVDDLGQPLYRVHTGRFVSHAQARTETIRLQRRHGLEGFVAGGTEH